MRSARDRFTQLPCVPPDGSPRGDQPRESPWGEDLGPPAHSARAGRLGDPPAPVQPAGDPGRGRRLGHNLWRDPEPDSPAPEALTHGRTHAVR